MVGGALERQPPLTNCVGRAKTPRSANALRTTIYFPRDTNHFDATVTLENKPNGHKN